jgi:hypothetical protein
MTTDPNAGDDDLPVVVDSLAKKFPDIDRDVVAETVDDAHAPLLDAHIQEYVPVLVEHQAQVRLNELEHEHEVAAATEEPDAS